jgi:integrase
MKTLICTYQVSEARKELLVDAYDYYAQFKGLAWNKPKFTREDKPIFLPIETELETLIGHARFKMSVFLQLLKETAADSGEAWKLRWIDIDPQNNKVSITPTKNHNGHVKTDFGRRRHHCGGSWQYGVEFQVGFDRNPLFVPTVARELVEESQSLVLQKSYSQTR